MISKRNRKQEKKKWEIIFKNVSSIQQQLFFDDFVEIKKTELIEMHYIFIYN